MVRFAGVIVSDTWRNLFKKMLVFFGGVDADNYTGCAIEALSEIATSGLQVDVVIGAQHPYRDQKSHKCPS